MRITDKILNSFVDAINKKKNQPIATWTKNKKGLNKANIGNYHLNYTNGHVELCQITNEGGSNTSICSSCTNRELYYFMRGFLEGCDKVNSNEKL
jgi:hypothetical protein